MITLLHPSRGRAAKSAANTQDWITKAGIPPQDLEVIVSLDEDDPQKDEYWKQYVPVHALFDKVSFKLIVNHNQSVVDATNHAARVSKGDIMIYLSDDFKCPENWAVLVQKEFEGEDRPLLIKVNDGLQPFDVAVLTIPIMNRALFEKMKYFWFPGYKSMFVDEDLYWTVHKLWAMKMCPQLLFQHEHPANGKAPNDETYIRSSRNWDQGKKLFAERRGAGFQ